MSKDEAKGEFVGRRYLEERYSRCGRTLARWLENPSVQFPQPALHINNRRYWRMADILDWERRRAVASIQEAA